MNLPWRGILVVIGAFLIHLTLGTLFTDGNLGPYLISYMRLHGDPSITSASIVWITATQMGMQGFFMAPSGILAKKIGSRITCIIGCLIQSSSTALTYFTCNSTFWVFLVTYGILFGVGIGIAYITALSTAMKWFPAHRGIVNGIVVGGFGLGSFVFNQIQTAFINPENMPANDEGYFTQDEVVKKVPDVFLLLGGTYFAIQLLGCGMIDSVASDNQTRKQGETNEDLSPKEVLKRKEFYVLFFTMFFNAMIVTFFNSMYKAYGEQFIDDDHYLAVLGSVGSVLNALSRIGWGTLADRISYRVCMMSMCSAVAFFTFSMPATPNGGKIMYTVWALGLYMSTAGTYALLPTCTAKTFGQTYVTYNYGMIFANCVISSPLTAALTQTLLGRIGYEYMFILLGSLSCISMLLTYFFNELPSDDVMLINKNTALNPPNLNLTKPNLEINNSTQPNIAVISH